MINLWLALRDDATAAIRNRLEWDEELDGPYIGPVTPRQHKLFSYMQDHSARLNVFRKRPVGARTWSLWTIDFDLPGNTLQLVKDEIDQLLIDYPTQVSVGGAWYYDSGLQVTDGNGIPVYPVDPALIHFMPDVDDIGTRPTEISDVNLLMGQAHRDFTIY